MNNPPITRVIVIRNPQGLHARPAQMFVRLAMQFESRIELVHDGRRVDGKSMLDVLTLAATQGTRLVLEADGQDAVGAVEALAKLVEDGFGLVEDQESGQQEQQVQQGG
jgi:phosphotransferase system HPr (HPr) family protein